MTGEQRTAVYSAEHVAIFVCHCTRDQTLLDTACKELIPTHIKELGGTTALAVVFSIVQNFYEKYKLAPDEAALVAEFKQYTRIYAQTPEIRDRLLKLFSGYLTFSRSVDDASKGLAYDILKFAIDMLKVRPAIREELERAKQTEDYKDLGDRIREISAQQFSLGKSISFNGATQFSGDNYGQRLPTYLQWFDSRVSAPGPVRGGCMGIIGSSGGGKTTLGINLAIEQSLAGKYAALALVEEWSRSVQRKLIACATHIPTQVIEKHGDDLDRVIAEEGLDAELILAKRTQVDKHMHVMDLTREGDCDTIRNELLAWKQRGVMPDYFYLDWAGELADRLVGSDRRFRDDKRGAISFIVKNCADWARDFDIFTAVSQQMSAEVAERGPFVKSDQYCAMDCRTFPAHLKYCLILNPADEVTKLQVVRFGKVRDEAKVDPFPLRLRGEISRFEDASNQYTVNAGGRVVRTARRDQDGKIPEE